MNMAFLPDPIEGLNVTAKLSLRETLENEVAAWVKNGGEPVELRGFREVTPRPVLKSNKAPKKYAPWRPKPMPGNRYFTAAESKHIQEYAVKHHGTMRALSVAVGFNPGYLSGRIHGQSAIRPADMARILSFVGLPVDKS